MRFIEAMFLIEILNFLATFERFYESKLGIKLLCTTTCHLCIDC